MDNFRRKKRLLGVTLPEMLVVISIVVILALISIWFLRTQQLKGNDAKRKGDIHRIQVAIEEYEKDNDCYPLPQFVVCNSGGGLKPYISKIPCDPETNASYFYEHEDSVCPLWYRIYANLQNLSDPDISGSCGPGYAFNYCVTSPNAPSPDCTEGGNGESPPPPPPPPPQDFYGCFSGSCLPISWDPERPGAECDPNYGNSTCYGQCTDPGTGAPQNECQPW